MAQTGATTTNNYSGSVSINVSGSGQAAGTAFSDAFYLFTDGSGNPITPEHHSDFGLCINNQSIENYLATIPSYRNDHTYQFTISIGNSPQQITFGVCDTFTSDNSGSFSITVTATAPPPAPEPPPPPPPAPPQCTSRLTVQRVSTRDAAGTDKTTFAPAEAIQFAAELNNSYGGALLAANGTQLTITTSFFNNTKPVDIPPDISTWTWNATAPSAGGNYAVTVRAFDHFCGTLPEGSTSFTVGANPPPTAPPAAPQPPPVTTVILEQAQTLKGVGDVGQVQTQFMPGEAIRYAALVNNPGSSEVSRRFDFRASGPREIFSWVGDISLRPSRWIRYFSTSVPTDAPPGNYTLRVTMTENGQTSIKESSFTVRQTPTPPPPTPLPPPPLTRVTLKQALTRNEFNKKRTHFTSGKVIRYAALVNNRGSRTVTPQFDFRVSGPREIFSWIRNVSIPPGRWSIGKRGTTVLRHAPAGNYTLRVTMTENGQTSIKESSFTVTTAQPEGKAPNLIVLVHGCCTNAEQLSEWHTLRNTIIDRLKNRYGKDWKKHWEIVVWDWSDNTPNPPIWDILNFIGKADIAYISAPFEGSKLAVAISTYPYRYVHLIAHSAGAKLIDEAASQIALNNIDQPFIHLTFLDAYTRDDNDTINYGGFPVGYPHYVEHYVDRGLPSTDACLSNAFNFDISRWSHSPTESLTFGHHWPIHWYQNSVTSTSPKFKYGYTLSLEGSNDRFDELATLHPPGKQCGLDTGLFNENPNPDCQQAACW